MNGQTILVVEDDTIISMNIVDLVSSTGFVAIDAFNAEEAIQILESRNDVGLVFTDVQMPGTMDGVGLTHYIRAHWPKIRLIVTSARLVEKNDLPSGSKFFPKPYIANAVIAEMKRMLTIIDTTNP